MAACAVAMLVIAGACADDETASTTAAGGGPGSGGAGGLVPGDCGDGVVNVGEGCDDANDVTFDGCDACEVSDGFACEGNPSACAPICGDGMAVLGPETSCADCVGDKCTSSLLSCATDAECAPFLACIENCTGSCIDTCLADHPNDNATAFVTCLKSDCEPECYAAREACDGSDFAGMSCTDFGYASMEGLICQRCEVDASGCSAVCGNDVIEPGEQCEGATADCTQCQFSGNTCNGAIPIGIGLERLTITSTTLGGGNHEPPLPNCPAAGPARIYLVTPTQDGFLTAVTDPQTTSIGTTLYAMADCADASSAIICDSAVTNGPGADVISMPVTAGTPVYVIVNTSGGNGGDFGLILDVGVGDCTDPAWIPVFEDSYPTAVGDTNLGFSNHDHSCGASGSKEIVYEITGNNVLGILSQPVPYDAVLASRTSCGDVSTELNCSQQDPPTSPESTGVSASPGTPGYVFVDGNGSSGSYRLRFQYLPF